LGVAQVITFLECIGEVLLPTIFGVNRAKGGIDAPCGEYRMGIAFKALTHDDDIATGFVGGNRGTHARRPTTNHQHIRHIRPMNQIVYHEKLLSFYQ
jgi:hypothetical protein